MTGARFEERGCPSQWLFHEAATRLLRCTPALSGDATTAQDDGPVYEEWREILADLATIPLREANSHLRLLAVTARTELLRLLEELPDEELDRYFAEIARNSHTASCGPGREGS